MRLKTWLYVNNITVTNFAKHLGLSRAYVSRVVSGDYTCSAKVADAIEAATGGQITAERILDGSAVGDAQGGDDNQVVTSVSLL